MATVYEGLNYHVVIGAAYNCSYLENVIMNSHGFVHADSGGVIRKVVVNKSASLYVDSHGVVYDVTVNGGGNLIGFGVYSGITANAGATISDDGIRSTCVLADGGYIERMSNGCANGNISGLNFHGRLYTWQAALSDCTVNLKLDTNNSTYSTAVAYFGGGTVISGGVISGLGRGKYAASAFLSSGGRAYGTLIDGGVMTVSSGAAVSGVKLSESGDGIILHAAEVNGERRECVFAFDRPVRSVETVDFTEKPLPADEAPTADGRTVRFTPAPNTVFSLKITF